MRCGAKLAGEERRYLYHMLGRLRQGVGTRHHRRGRWLGCVPRRGLGARNTRLFGGSDTVGAGIRSFLSRSVAMVLPPLGVVDGIIQHDAIIVGVQVGLDVGRHFDQLTM